MHASTRVAANCLWYLIKILLQVASFHCVLVCDLCRPQSGSMWTSNECSLFVYVCMCGCGRCSQLGENFLMVTSARMLRDQTAAAAAATRESCESRRPLRKTKVANYAPLLSLLYSILSFLSTLHSPLSLCKPSMRSVSTQPSLQFPPSTRLLHHLYISHYVSLPHCHPPLSLFLSGTLQSSYFAAAAAQSTGCKYQI